MDKAIKPVFSGLNVMFTVKLVVYLIAKLFQTVNIIKYIE